MSGRGMAQKNLDLIEHSRRILAGIQPSTSRGVAYQLFTQGLIENMGGKCVRNVSRMLVIARDAWEHCHAVEKAERESLNAYVRAWPKSNQDQKCDRERAP